MGSSQTHNQKIKPFMQLHYTWWIIPPFPKVPATSEFPKHWHQPKISKPSPWQDDELTHLQPPVEPSLDMGSLNAQISPWFETSKPGRITAVSRKGTCYFFGGRCFYVVYCTSSSVELQCLLVARYSCAATGPN